MTNFTLRDFGYTIADNEEVLVHLTLRAEGGTVRSILDDINAFVTGGGKLGEVSRDTETVQEPSTRRRRSGADEAPATTTEPAAATPSRRSRGSAAPAEEPKAEPEVTPAPTRRTRTTAPAEPEVKTITEADLSLAASNAAPIIGTEVVLQILEEDFKVKETSSIKSQEDRAKFLEVLADEVKAAREDLSKDVAG